MAMIHQAIKKQDETIKGFRKSTSYPEYVETQALLQDNAPILKEKSLTKRLLSWCRQQESNLRPPGYESGALPTELYRQRKVF